MQPALEPLLFNTGGIAVSNSAGANLYGIKCDNYMYANGTPVSFSGTYSNSNVASYLPTYNGNILATTIQSTTLTTGANSTAGTVTGNWSLSAGSRFNATYADIGERHNSDAIYPIGTVVKVGGENEITAVGANDAPGDVLGVVSNTAAYILNADAGNDDTHPVIGLVGRVPVRILGPVNKGDKIAPASNGCASNNSLAGFGWALETNKSASEKLVLCVIK